MQCYAMLCRTVFVLRYGIATNTSVREEISFHLPSLPTKVTTGKGYPTKKCFVAVLKFNPLKITTEHLCSVHILKYQLFKYDFSFSPFLFFHFFLSSSWNCANFDTKRVFLVFPRFFFWFLALDAEKWRKGENAGWRHLFRVTNQLMFVLFVMFQYRYCRFKCTGTSSISQITLTCAKTSISTRCVPLLSKSCWGIPLLESYCTVHSSSPFFF